MKKYNLEQQLAEKLGSRSISPSDNAWERIAFNRQQQAGKKSRKKRSLYWVAASVAVLLIGGYFFMMALSTPINVNATPQVVQGKDAMPKQQTPNYTPNPSQIANVVTEPEYAERKTGNMLPNTKPTNNKDNQGQFAAISNNTPLQLAPTEVALPETDIKAAGTVIAAARPQEDVLLEKAMQDVAAQKQFKQTTNQEALLKEVESEMDEYYREKALRFFSLKYKKIRIVVKDNH